MESVPIHPMAERGYPGPRRRVRKLIITLASVGLFFPSMLALLFELDWMENTVGGTWFVLLVLAVAAVPAWLAGRAIRRLADPRRNLFLLQSAEERAHAAREASSAGFLTFVGVLTLSLVAASRMNHARAAAADDVAVTVVEREYRPAGPRSGEAHRLIVDVDGRREDVVVSAAEWERSGPGSAHRMRRLHGALGFDVLYSDNLRRRPCAARARHAAGPSTPAG